MKPLENWCEVKSQAWGTHATCTWLLVSLSSPSCCLDEAPWSPSVEGERKSSWGSDAAALSRAGWIFCCRIWLMGLGSIHIWANCSHRWCWWSYHCFHQCLWGRRDMSGSPFSSQLNTSALITDKCYCFTACFTVCQFIGRGWAGQVNQGTRNLWRSTLHWGLG